MRKTECEKERTDIHVTCHHGSHSLVLSWTGYPSDANVAQYSVLGIAFTNPAGPCATDQKTLINIKLLLITLAQPHVLHAKLVVKPLYIELYGPVETVAERFRKAMDRCTILNELC